MHGRIFGVETEYGAIAYRHDARGRRRQVTGIDVVRRLAHAVGGAQTDGFIANGARIYVDHGDHPEYATPECASVNDLVAAITAGHRLLDQSRRAIARSLRDEVDEVCVFFNNTDARGESFGMHENFSIPRNTNVTELTLRLAPLLASLPLLTGAGLVAEHGSGVRVLISPRGTGVREVATGLATRDRPMVKLTDQFMAENQTMARFQVVCGDSNPSQWALALRIGAIHLALRMYEEARPLLPTRTLADPVRAIQAFSGSDPSARAATATQGTVSAYELLDEWLDAAAQFVAEHGTSEDRATIERWSTSLAAAKAGPSALVPYAAWAAKYEMANAMIGRGDSPARVQNMDLAFHTVDASRNFAERMAHRGSMVRVAGDAAVGHFMQHPPDNTRAHARAQILRAAGERKIAADWWSMGFSIGDELVEVAMPDPGDPNLPALPPSFERRLAASLTR